MSEPLKIVVLEDDEGLCELIRRRLVRERHECVCFHKAAHALEWLSSNSADLMVMDLVLPDFSGEELISKMARLNIKIPFIVATGQGSESVAVKLLKKGARDYMVKNSEFLNVLPSTIEMVWRELQLESLLEKAREQISLQNAMLSAVYDCSPDGILVSDTAGKIISFNKPMLEMFSSSREEIHGRTVHEFFSIVSARLNLGREFLSKISSLQLDSSQSGLSPEQIAVDDRTMELFSELMLGPGKAFLGRIWYLRDISIHIKAREAVEKARVETENNTRTKSRFFAIISHDIKTPLNSILGFINLLGKTSLDETQREYADIIKSSGDHLVGLINDLLDISKIEHGSLVLSIQKISIRDLLKGCVESFLPAAKASGVELSLHVGEYVPQIIEGDLTRLRQVMLNLLGNALKFTSRGHVRVFCAQREDGMVEIRVADTGIGISEDAVKNIFLPFSQADSSISEKFGGCGLGLAVSKMLIEKFGGSLSVESEPGKGSVFSFAIPVSPPS